MNLRHRRQAILLSCLIHVPLALYQGWDSANAATNPASANLPRGVPSEGQVNELSDNPDIRAFGARCDGTSHTLASLGFKTLQAAQQHGYPAATNLTNEADWAAITQALSSLGETGGSVLIDARARCVVNADVVLPQGTALRGTLSLRGQPNRPWIGQGSALILQGATIRPQSSSGLEGLLIERAGLTYRESDSSAFSGIGVDTEDGANDVYVVGSAIIGFSTAFKTPSGGRIRLENDYLDAQTCVDAGASRDSSRYTHLHCWPFATAATATSPASNDRSGMGFYFHGGADGMVVDDILSFQHRAGGLVFGASAGNATATHIFIDGEKREPRAGETENGIWFQPGSDNIDISQVDIYGQDVGVLVNTGGVGVSLSNIRVHGSYKNSVVINQAIVTGSNWLSDGPGIGDAIVVRGNAAKLLLNGLRARKTSPGECDVRTTDATTTLDIIGYDTDLPPTQKSMCLTGDDFPVVASADPLPLPMSGDTFIITGKQSFGSVRSWYPGRHLTFIVRDGLTIDDGGSFSLTGGTNAALRAGEVVQFVTTTGKLIETSRGGK